MPVNSRRAIAKAAAAQGTDVTSFVVEAATAKARRVLPEEHALAVSPAEALQIQALTESDSVVTPALAAAFSV